MTIEETPRHVANVAVATAPVVSYLSGVSLVLTIIASIVSILWMGSSVWKMFFPEHFDTFVKKINRK